MGPNEERAADAARFSRQLRINDLKSGALLVALAGAQDELGNGGGDLGRFVSVTNQPKPGSVFSGDFCWGRLTEEAATIVAGDATGHNAYAGLLRLLVRKALDEVARPRASGEELTADQVLEQLKQTFFAAKVRGEAALAEALRHHPDLTDVIEQYRADGLVGACCRVTACRVEIACSGLPVFIVHDDFRVAHLGELTSAGPSGEGRRPKTIGPSLSSISLQHANFATGVRFLIVCSDGVLSQKTNSTCTGQGVKE